MKKVLLISNYVFHYRLNNYNYFFEEFKKAGYEFIVLANDAQKVDFEIKFQLIVKKPSVRDYFKTIKNINPDVVITFLHLKDWILYFVNYYCKIKKIPLIYWNFGVNTATPDSTLKNQIYYHIHNLSDAIVLYSPNEKKYVKTHNQKKIFIGYNTLNFEGLDRNTIGSKSYLKEKFNIKEDFIVLYSGRITANKKLHLLLEILRNNKDIAIVVVGRGMTSDLKDIIDKVDNYYYLGEIGYDKYEIARIFKIIDELEKLGWKIIIIWERFIINKKFQKSLTVPMYFVFREIWAWH